MRKSLHPHGESGPIELGACSFPVGGDRIVNPLQNGNCRSSVTMGARIALCVSEIGVQSFAQRSPDFHKVSEGASAAGWAQGLGRLWTAFYCLSLWIAVPFVIPIGEGSKERILLWPALSAGRNSATPVFSAGAAQSHLSGRRENPNVLSRKGKKPVSTTARTMSNGAARRVLVSRDRLHRAL